MTRRQKHDFILLCALRYALWRHSYAPSLVAEYIEENWDKLGRIAKHNIIRDLTEHINDVRDEWQNDVLCSIDLDTWENLLNKLQAKDSNATLS